MYVYIYIIINHMIIQNKLTSVCVGKHLISESAGLGLPLRPFTKEPCKKLWDLNLNPTVAWGHFCAGLWDWWLSCVRELIFIQNPSNWLAASMTFHTESNHLGHRMRSLTSAAVKASSARTFWNGHLGCWDGRVAGWQNAPSIPVMPRSLWNKKPYPTVWQCTSVYKNTVSGDTLGVWKHLSTSQLVMEYQPWNNLHLPKIVWYPLRRSYCALSWKQYSEEIQRKPSSGRKALKKEPINSWFHVIPKCYPSEFHSLCNMGFPLQY